jgi:ribonuclease HI
LEAARAHDVDRIRIVGDSELVVKQLTGEYRVNASNLEPLVEEVRALLEQFDEWSIEHVGRNQNERADGLANRAFDT